MSKKKKIVTPSETEIREFGRTDAQASESQPEPPAQESEETPDGTIGEPESATSQPEEQVVAEAEQWKEKYLRAKAELANYQRRTQKERTESLRYANAELVKKVLPVLDDLERVLSNSGTENTTSDAIIDGIKLTLENFLTVLTSFGVARIEAEGQPFDPEVHEAMMEQPSSEHPARTVLQEVAKGYKLHDRVLRPAKVIVSKAAQEQLDDEEIATNENHNTCA